LARRSSATRYGIEALCRLGHAGVEKMGVPLERDKRVRVARDALDELDVGARGDEARDARMPQVVETVALVGDTCESERRVPDALPEVRRL
jgi:hypothetical protein